MEVAVGATDDKQKGSKLTPLEKLADGRHARNIVQTIIIYTSLEPF